MSDPDPFDAMTTVVKAMRTMTARFALANRAMSGEEILVVAPWTPPRDINLAAHRAAYTSKVERVVHRLMKEYDQPQEHIG